MKKKNIVLGLAVVAALNVASFQPANAGSNPFATVPQSTGYYQDVAALVHDGLIDGYADSDFKANRPLTRYEMAVFTAKAMSNSNKANAADTQRIQKLMKAFQSELTDMHVAIPGVKAKTASQPAKDKGPKIKSMPKNFSLSGLVRFRYDDGWKYVRKNGKDSKGADGFGGTKNHQLLWQLFTKFDVGGGWKGEIDFLGAKDGDGDRRTTGENTEGYADVNKVFFTGPLFGTTARIGRTKGSTVYKNSMIMGQYYQGVNLTKQVSNKWKVSASYGKVDYNTDTFSGSNTYVNNYDSKKDTLSYKAERGVSGSDMNPDGLGVMMTEVQFGYQAANNLQLNGSWWHLKNDGSDHAWSSNGNLKYPNPDIGEIGFDWQATPKFNLIGHYAQGSYHANVKKAGDAGYTQGSPQNKAYALTGRWGKVVPAKAHSRQFQLDLIHQERYTGIKSSYDLKNKAGEGQRGFIADYRYVPIQNIMFDFRWMHYKSMGNKAYKEGTTAANQYRFQLYYYF